MIIYIIRFIHLLVFLFILAAPFYNKRYLEIAIILVLYILYKWYIDGSCGLTVLEYYMMGHKEESQGFIYRLVNPLLSINESLFTEYLNYFTISWLLLLIIIYFYRYC